jgi:hypothetical protein
MDGFPIRRLLAGVLVLSGCTNSAPPAATPSPSRGVASTPAATEGGVPLPAVAGVTADDVREGEALFNDICGQCHTVDPPAKLAPPIRHVMRHLRTTFADDGEVLDHLLSYLPSPDAARSALPSMAVERFGVMPPQPLPADILRKVGAYVLTLDDSRTAGAGEGTRTRMRRHRGHEGARGHGGMRGGRGGG